MKKDDLNSSLHILNILLFIYSFGMYFVFFIIAYFSPNDIIPKCFVLLCMLAKIVLLYILFSTFEKFYPYSTESKIVKELKDNKSSRKSALLLAFAYDAVIILCCLLFFSLKEYHFEWVYILAYEILTLGGVCMFYISLFSIWKIQDKLKKRKF